MATSKQIQQWLPFAYATFTHYIPLGDLRLPPAYTTTDKDYERKRAALVEATGCMRKGFSLKENDIIMEMIHGDNGDAILMRNRLIPGPSQQDNAFEVFCRYIWHELGHFFAIQKETDNLHRYNDLEIESPFLDNTPYVPLWKDGKLNYSEDRIKQEGYWFWSEFIAESISLYVSEMDRRYGNAKNYRPELLTWEPENWHGIIVKLTKLLDDAVSYYDSTIDEHSLAFYFATLLMDDLTKYYVQAGQEGRLIRYKNNNGLWDVPTEYEIIPAGSIDTTCIDEMLEEFQPPLRRMHDLLKSHMVTDGHETEHGFMESHEFWHIDEEFLLQLGQCIVDLMSAKLMVLADAYLSIE